MAVTVSAFTSTVTNSSSLAAAPAFPPTGLTGSSGLDAQTSLTWSTVTGATDYQVQWRTNGAGSWTTAGWTGGATSTTIGGLTNNTVYEFQVQARNGAGTSTWSASVLATPRQWAQLSIGGSHACAVTVTGRAYCWGSNASGQIGDGTFGVDRKAPVPVDTSTGLTISNVRQISAGASHTCAVTTTGRAYCWGSNASGQIGDNTTGTNRLTPTAVDTSTGLTSTTVATLAAGSQHTCAVTVSGQAYCWGYNTRGQLGDTTTSQRTTPTAVDTSTGLTTTNVASLGVAGNDTCAVTTTGQAYCWGWNANGQVGDNASGTDRLTPTPVNTTTGLTTTNVAGISNAGTHVCAVTTTGQAYCWGANSNGQIGDNTSGADRLTPTPVYTTTGLTTTNVTQIARGASTCAVTTTGQAYCWGANSNGEVADNTTTSPRLTPRTVNTTTGLTTTNVAAVSAGGNNACALTTPTAGTIYCWGLNSLGQVGDNTSGTNRLTPTPLATTPIPTAPPSAPTGLTASMGPAQVALSWTALAGAGDYQVQWRTNGVGNWTTATSTTGTTLTVTGLTNGTAYEFQVRAHTAGGFGPWTTSVTAAPVATPTGLATTSGLDAQVSLTWSTATGATDYQVQWRINGTGSWTQAGWTGGATSTTVTGLTNNTLYDFQVQSAPPTAGAPGRAARPACRGSGPSSTSGTAPPAR